MCCGSSRPRILGVGLACLDYLFLSPPVAPGQGGPLRDYRVQGGGVIGTALVAAARLGAHAELWSWVGDDETGRLVLSELAEEGVATENVGTVGGARTPVSFVQADEKSGERTMGGSSSSTPLSLTPIGPRPAQGRPSVRGRPGSRWLEIFAPARP